MSTFDIEAVRKRCKEAERTGAWIRARTDLPAALDEIERLRAEIEQSCREFDKLATMHLEARRERDALAEMNVRAGEALEETITRAERAESVAENERQVAANLGMKLQNAESALESERRAHEMTSAAYERAEADANLAYDARDLAVMGWKKAEAALAETRRKALAEVAEKFNHPAHSRYSRETVLGMIDGWAHDKNCPGSIPGNRTCYCTPTPRSLIHTPAERCPKCNYEDCECPPFGEHPNTPEGKPK